MATIMLEVKSDIEGMSALDMALDFGLTQFVADQRIERVVTSIMNDFEFLRPRNRDEAFEIDPLSVKLIWRKMFYTQFYFTPLGTYTTEVFLYFCYMFLFTMLSLEQFRVYDPMSSAEIAFWIFNAGYVANEIQSLISEGFKMYFADTENYFDTLISVVFVASIILRLWALLSDGPYCDGWLDEDGQIIEDEQGNVIMDSDQAGSDITCWSRSAINTGFVILWGIATITLWLRIINFFVLSHSLGPMVAMIFRMLSDIMTFFEIMVVLFIAFAMALVFILGDVMEGFSGPVIAMITLFRALLGDFDFDNLAEANVSSGILYFGYGIVIFYLIIGSLILLNLLIAMMAKTFDAIEEDTTAAIIYSRFELALDRDTTASYMPPPLNVFAMGLMIIFYLVEICMNSCGFICAKCCCCCKDKEKENEQQEEKNPKYPDFIPRDLAVAIMPRFMKERKLELDDQILYENCETYWTITTNKGPTRCKIIKYKPEIGDHYVRFYSNEKDEKTGKYKGIKVSVQNSVDKKHQWQLDLFDLHSEGLIEFSQFNSVSVNSKWTALAHHTKKLAKKKGQNCPYWICGFCRGYVKASKISVKRLGYMMNVNDIEMKVINKVSPEVCPNCYRVRLERERWALVWEIISYWIYKIVVRPFLFFIFFIVIVFGLIQNPHDLAQAVEKAKTRIMRKKEEVAEAIDDAIDDAAEFVGIQDDDEDEDKTKNKGDPRYVSYHYADTQLISNMNEMDHENDTFDVAVRDDVWELLADAKNDIDAFLLGEKINRHIMSLSSEDELTTFEFYDNFINMEALKKGGGDFLWIEYFKPLSETIFDRIQRIRNDYVPLHLFKRYPFDLHFVLDDMSAHYDHKENFDKKLNQINVDDIIDALNSLQSLNCINEEQRRTVISSVADNEKQDDVWHETGSDNKPFDKFVRYMTELQKLFQDTRTLKNMLRDVNTAIIERGAACSVFRDQIHFLFEDVRNVTLATPFFNSMRTEEIGGELKVELWTIRNTLWCLYFLNDCVRETILRRHSKLYVKQQTLLNIVYKSFSEDISDPEGITDLIATETHSDSEDDDNLPEKADSMEPAASIPGLHEPSKSLGFAQRSTVGFLPPDEDDHNDGKTEEERATIVADRMELFHKGAITASAVRDEITSIFQNIQSRRANKITESTIDFYRRNGLKNAKILQDDESLRYVFEQLSRYATFYPKHMKQKASVDTLKQIFYNTLQFGDKYGIDDEVIPRIVRKDKYIQQLYDHLYDIYNDTCKNKFNSIIMEQTLEYMTLEDVLSMIMLYERTFSVLRAKAVEHGDQFVASHDVFCKFVDNGKHFDKDKGEKGEMVDNYDPDLPEEEWSNKTQAASELYQAALDEAQQFVTLGQIRQTVDKLIHDIAAMKCGELTRIMNHLQKQFKKDDQRCKDDRVKYVEFLRYKKENNLDDADEIQTQLSFKDMDLDKKVSEYPSGQPKRMKNPGLAFKHISKNKWNQYIDGIASNFRMNVKSSAISSTLHDEEHKDLEEHKHELDQGGSKKIIEAILDNTSFDVLTFDDNDNNVPQDEEKYNNKDKNKKTKQYKRKARSRVYDTVLSFCSGRITLQQLFQFSRLFLAFLKKNTKIDKKMKQYHKIVSTASGVSTEANNFLRHKQMKKKKIGSDFDKFKKDYFEEFWDDTFEAEVQWLYTGCENELDLCHKMYPFWSGSIIEDIYSFMESTEQIQGNYELKEAEFGQLKHSLNVNDELAIKLFHIIRFKIRTLTWKQIYNYYKFLLKMKYNVQRAILKSKQSEDTTVSMDGIKMLLKIQLNDEAKWLFSKVDSLHGAKVTWKQIRKYLTKIITVRDEMRDFFRDNARNRDYEDNKAEIINGISENAEKAIEVNESLEDKLLAQLHEITKKLNKLEKKIDAKQDVKGGPNKDQKEKPKRMSNLGDRQISLTASDEKRKDEMPPAWFKGPPSKVGKKVDKIEEANEEEEEAQDPIYSGDSQQVENEPVADEPVEDEKPNDEEPANSDYQD